MSKGKLLGALKQSDSAKKSNEETIQPTAKIQRQKRLSSKEFLDGYDAMWKEGPTIKFHNPDAWVRHSSSESKSQ